MTLDYLPSLDVMCSEPGVIVKENAEAIGKKKQKCKEHFFVKL